MPVTEYKRFQTVDDSGNWISGDSNAFLEGNEGGRLFFNTNAYVILSNPVSFNLSPGVVIQGIEFNLKIVPNILTSNQIWSGKVSTNSILEADLTDTLLTIPPPGTAVETKYTIGGSENLFGLDLTHSNVDNLRFGIKVTTFGGGSILGGFFGIPGTGSPPNDLPAPALRIHYALPPVVARPGPNFMSSNVDLTKFNGLGDKTSPLQSPPSSEDLFGFTSTIVPKGDNSSQATDSVFGDAANFGKLGLNRGGGTGISSDTGLLDTSKAPLSVRKGFRGL